MRLLPEEAVDARQAVVPDAPSDVRKAPLLQDPGEDEPGVPPGIEVRRVVLGEEPRQGRGNGHLRTVPSCHAPGKRPGGS
jgi:hypothetical protein